MSQAIKVGIFATVALVVLAVFILKIEDWNPFGEEGPRLVALFDSVAGLDDKAAVRIAGVRVGRVDGIGLEGRQAEVGLRLEQPVPLTEGTRARVANMGLLGDKYIEIVPGPPEAPPLAPGAVLQGETPPTFDDAMAQLSDIGQSIQQVTGSFGEAGGASLGRLIENLEATTAEIQALVAANRAQVDSTVRNFESVSATLARELPQLTAKTQALVDQISGVIAENRQQLAAGVDNVESLTAALETSAADLNQISGRLARGEGSLGKLLSTDEAHDELVATLDSIQGGVDTLSDTLGRAQRLKLDLGLEGAWLEDREESLASFGLTLDPNAEDGNKLYRVALVNTPQGDLEEKTVRTVTTNPDGSTETTIRQTFTREDKAVFSGLLGLRLRNGTRLWGGLIEEEFGVEVEHPLLDRRLWLDLEVFDFDRESDRDPHLRLSGRWFMSPNVYVWGGYDDPLESELDSIFFGGGITWNDDNLKYLLGSVPAGAF